VQLLERLIEFAFGSNLYKATRPGSGTWYQRILAWLDSMVGLLHTVSDHDLPDCYWRTLVGDYDIVASRFPTNPAQIEPCRTLRRSLDLLCKQVALTGSSSPTIPPLIELVMEKHLQFNFENHWTHLDRIWSARTFLYNGRGGRGEGILGLPRLASDRETWCASSMAVQASTFSVKNPGRDVREFVDDGFTLGLMDGEAFDLLEKGLNREHEFVLE
jgi:hypothetical protein